MPSQSFEANVSQSHTFGLLPGSRVKFGVGEVETEQSDDESSCEGRIL